MSRQVALLVYPGFQILDVTGPIAAFEVANGLSPNAYTLQLVAVAAAEVASSSGITMRAAAWPPPSTIDTLLLAGGHGSRAAAECERTRGFINACIDQARRVASVCSGAYLLAAAGALDGKRATTHWSCTKDLRSRYPSVRIDSDQIYVKQGKVWTSAGVTAGIDMTLALIAEDLGERIARRVAQYLVVYHRRPGGQSQFSALLDLEPTSDDFTALLEHMRCNLRKPLSVADLAARMSMSPRHFAREFRAATGVTPAKAVERMRTEAARTALESGRRSVQEIARSCGFGSAERMRRTFVRIFGNSPMTMKRSSQVSMR